jgi:rod shape-determining protein MreC
MFSSLSRRRVLMLVVLTCVLLITLDTRGNAVIDGMRKVFARVVQPFDVATRAVAMPLARAWNGVANYDDVRHENEVLRDQIEHMKGNDIEARSAVLEYRELLKLNQLTSKFQFDTVEAQVVGESPSNFQNTIEINVGSRQGVAPGMPVTDGAGLIGRITKVFPTRSIVLLLTDPSFAISAQVLSTPDQIEEQQRPTESTLLTGQSASALTSTTTSTTTTIVLPPGLEPLTTDPEGGTGADSGTGTGTTTVTTSPVTTTTLAAVIRETGMLEGQGADRALALRFVDTSSSLTSVRVGAVVDTAGGNNGLAPQGIPIGVITNIKKLTGSTSSLVEVTPNASLKKLNFVAVVLYVPNNDAVGK